MFHTVSHCVTSCRSESSNISLVVLDKEDGSQQALPRHHSRPALGGIGVKFVRVAGDVSGNVGSQALLSSGFSDVSSLSFFNS